MYVTFNQEKTHRWRGKGLLFPFFYNQRKIHKKNVTFLFKALRKAVFLRIYSPSSKQWQKI